MNKEIKWMLYWVASAIILSLISGELFSKVSVIASSLVLSFPAFIVGYYLVERVVNNSARKIFPNFIVLLMLIVVSLLVYSVLFMDL